MKSWLVVFFHQQDTQQTSSLETGNSLSVRLLVSGAGTWTTELLGFAATRIGDQQATIVVDEDILDFLFGGFIHIYRQPIKLLHELCQYNFV